MSIRIIGLSTLRGALLITQERATIDIRLLEANVYAFSIHLKDDIFFFENGSELEPCDVDKVRTYFLAYESEGEPEYDIVKDALNL